MEMETAVESVMETTIKAETKEREKTEKEGKTAETQKKAGEEAGKESGKEAFKEAPKEAETAAGKEAETEAGMAAGAAPMPEEKAEPSETAEPELRKLRKNQGLMHLIRRAHGLVENPDLEKHRQSQNHIGAILGNTRDIHYRKVNIQGMHGEWVSVNRAHMKKYVILHCHGGGYSTGSSLYARTLTSKLAASTSMDVLCFDYRLAPENPYPAACEDAMKVWDYLMLFGYGARDVILTGDSAGGNLALSLVLKLKQQRRLLPRGIVLMSPWTDLTSSGESFADRAELDPVLNRAYIDRMVHAYAEGQDLKEPFISPLYGDFCGFPPTYIQVGENEILLSDSTRLHQAFVDANVSVKMDIYPGMWHVFQMSPVKAARDAMDKNAEFIYDICR